jgi:hypothetical protein
MHLFLGNYMFSFPKLGKICTYIVAIKKKKVFAQILVADELRNALHMLLNTKLWEKIKEF